MKKSFRSVILDMIIVLIFLCGIGVMLYPHISNFVNERHMSRALIGYSKAVRDMKPEDFEAVFEAAREYNRKLREKQNPFAKYDRPEGYKDTLIVDSSGIMGYVMIEKIRVRLPFYHGTDERILQVAIGHLEGSSLPIGEPGDHAVLSAHRGLPSAKLFTDLPELGIGDTFILNVLDRKMTYEVDQILTVLPDSQEAYDALQLVPGEDLCTLMTCTPYGINTHRLLVRGHRIENSNAGTTDAPNTKESTDSSGQMDAGSSLDQYIPYIAVVFIIVFLFLFLIPGRNRKKEK